MTPEKRQVILAEIAKLMDSGKHPVEIVAALTVSGLTSAEAKQLVYEASSQVAPVSVSLLRPHEESDSVARSFRKYVVIGGLLTLGFCGVLHFLSSQAPVPLQPLQPSQPPQQEAPPRPDTQATVPALVPSQVTEPIWAADASTQVPQPGRNTYDHHIGYFRYGIIRHACDPGAAGTSSDLQRLCQAQAVARAEFAAGFDHNGIRIVTAGGAQQPAAFQYICILLDDPQRGGVYCATITPAVAFFAAPGLFDEKHFEYRDLAIEAGTADTKRYPIIERHDAKYVRQAEANRRKISIEEARTIALPLIDEWLKHNGYDAQSETFLQRSEKNDGYGYVFTVEGDKKPLHDEGTVTLFTVQVDWKSSKADLLLKTDCAEFLRLLRERGVVPKP